LPFDWQSIAVLLIVAGALAYVARRGLARLRSFRASRGPACAAGCGKCGDDETTTARPAKVLVQIGRQRK
jgi:hypothetical protein